MKLLSRSGLVFTSAAVLVMLSACGGVQQGPGAQPSDSSSAAPSRSSSPTTSPSVQPEDSAVTSPEPSPSQQSGGSMNPASQDGDGPIELVNLWRVSGVEEEDPDTWLRLDANEFQLWRDCGMISGAWVSDGSAFLASVGSASGECVTDAGIPGIGWLESVTQYQGASDGFELLASNGEVVASLTVDGAPQPIVTAAEFYAEPPAITAGVREALRPAAPLASHLRPATAEDLVGRWVPAEGAFSTDPHAVMDEDGTWTGSDGCNGAAGRWTVGGAGSLLATSGPSTLIGCDGVGVPTWVGLARTAGFDGDALILFDIHGEQLGSLKAG